MKLWISGLAAVTMTGTALALLAPSTGCAREAQADKITPKASVGEAAPSFELPSVTGDTVSLADYEGQIVVLHWQSRTCPWDIAYQPMLNDLAEEYADQDVVFLAINSNKTETDVDQLASYHQAGGIPYPILMDNGSETADAYDAQVTPHMFVLNTDHELVYQGSIESRPSSPGNVGSTEPHLVPVLDALIADEELPYTSTPAYGCSVKR